MDASMFLPSCHPRLRQPFLATYFPPRQFQPPTPASGEQVGGGREAICAEKEQKTESGREKG